MDQTNSSHTNNGIELQDANKAIRSNPVVYTQSNSKQMSNTNANESKRIIKQIVSLDSKKLKALGIESNILSALTKFNGNERSLSKTKPSKNEHQPSKSTATGAPSSSSTSSKSKSPAKQHISSAQPSVTARNASVVVSSKSPETPPTKKIHVLSNVLLNKHTLSLKDFTAIASSTPVKNTTVSYVSQVPNHDNVSAAINIVEDDPHTTNTTENPIVIISTTDDNNDSNVIEHKPNDKDVKNNEIRIGPEQRASETVHSLQIQSSEIESLKGFSTIDLECSQNKCESLKNEISSKPTRTIVHPSKISQTTENEHEIETDGISVTKSCESSSDNESDLEELKKEAQRIIELSESELVTSIQKNSPDLSLGERIDEDRLIDDFLDSTISSFNIPFIANNDDDSDDSSDSNSDHNYDSIDAAENECNDFDTNEAIEEKIEATDEHMTKQLDFSEAKQSKSQKRKTDTELKDSFDKTKRKKLERKSNVKDVNRNDTMQLNQPKVINEQVQLPMEIRQVNEEAKTINVKPQIEPTVKRGRKSKQTVLKEFFAVQNEASTSKSFDLPLDDSSSIVKDATVKSSRYGRVIKPKSYDLEIPDKVKLERKSSKDAIDSTTNVQATTMTNLTNASNAIVQPPKKRDRQKIFESSTISLHKTVEDNVTERIHIPLDTGDKCSDPFKINSVRKKSAEQSSSNEQIRINEQIILPEKLESLGRGRPPKNIMKKEPLDVNLQDEKSQTNPVFDEQPINDFSIANFVDSNEPTPNAVATKRRGRPSKNVPTEISDLAESSMLDASNNSIVIKMEENVMPSDRPRIKVKNPELLFKRPEPAPQPAVPQATGVVGPKKRGRKRLKPLDSEEDDMLIANGPKFKCGNCHLDIPVKRWKAHEHQHLGVTYRIGIDEAIDVDDSATQSRVMIRFMKHNKIQYLKCPKCDEKKKSALGYISHVEMCGLTEDEAKSLKAECEYCKKLYRKVSLPSHQQSFCAVRRLELAQQKADEMIKTACETEPDEQREEVVYSESGRPKRIIKKTKTMLSKAVDEFIKVGSKITGGTVKNWTNQLQVENIIQCTNENCTFQANNVDDMRTHFKQCRESILQCRICSRVEHSRDKIVEHIESEHSHILNVNESDNEDADNSDDDDFKATNESSCESSDGEFDNDDYVNDEDIDDLDGLRSNKMVRKKFKPSRRIRIIPLKRIMEEESPALWEMVSTFYTQILNSRSGYYRKTIQWTKEFIEQNYDLNLLALKDHTRIDIDFIRLPQRELNKFLGLLNLKSPSFMCRNENQYTQEKPDQLVDGNWNRLNFLENVINTHTKTTSAMLFCGGKIIAAEWIPFPNDYNGRQVLAVCAQSTSAKPISLTNSVPPEKCKTLIQLWSISTTKANTMPTIDSIEFMYGIAYEDGPICAMCFCPSDAYVASKRLAIVALPDTHGNVNIISLPDNISKAKNNAPTIIKVKIDIKLRLGFNVHENNAQTITQMAWSRVKGHKVFCAGYNTGLVAIWNFDHLNFSHMCKKGTHDGGIPALVPQFTFLGALSFITQLDLHADNEDNVRWVLVGALDRRVRLYDLHDPQLIPYTSQAFKSRIMSGAWPMHWPIYLTIIDAALARMNAGLHIKHVLYTDNQPRSTNFCIDCEPSNLSFSDWLNTGIFGTDAGDLIMINFQQLLLHDRYDESSEQKILSSTDVFYEEQPITSEDSGSDEQFKVLFNDIDEINLPPRTELRIAPIDQYPYARITRTAINPNESHQKLYAIGYELGFCRIHFMP